VAGRVTAQLLDWPAFRAGLPMYHLSLRTECRHRSAYM